MEMVTKCLRLQEIGFDFWRKQFGWLWGMSNWFDCLGETENWWGGGAAELCFTTLTHAVHNVLVTLCIEEQGRIQGGGGYPGGHPNFIKWGETLRSCAQKRHV